MRLVGHIRIAMEHPILKGKLPISFITYITSCRESARNYHEWFMQCVFVSNICITSVGSGYISCIANDTTNSENGRQYIKAVNSNHKYLVSLVCMTPFVTAALVFFKLLYRTTLIHKKTQEIVRHWKLQPDWYGSLA